METRKMKMNAQECTDAKGRMAWANPIVVNE